MLGSIISSTTIDLSRLPAPDVVQQIDYETILADALADLRARFPEFSALVESDPAYKLLQVFAYREMIVRQRANNAARSVMIAYAKGADLDHLAALFGVQRLVIVAADPVNDIAEQLESDDNLRERVLLAPDSYSVAGPTSAYVFHARSVASGMVQHATAISPAPGEVLVTVLSRTGDGSASPALLAEVEAAVGGDTVRPLTDKVSVAGATVNHFDIDARLWIYAGPDKNLILSTARAALDRYLGETRRLGRDIPLSAISAALHVGGVQRVEIVSPAADLVHDETETGFVDAITLTVAGRAQ